MLPYVKSVRERQLVVAALVVLTLLSGCQSQDSTSVKPDALSPIPRAEHILPPQEDMSTPSPTTQPTDTERTSSEAQGSQPMPPPTVDAGVTAGAESKTRARRTIAIDPGHGGPESGAAAFGLVEKEVNLQIALKLAELLRSEGYVAVLTREKDEATHPAYQGGGYGGGLALDLQARIDTANNAGADLFISIHNNGHPDPNQSGTEVYYNKLRSFADRNRALAQLVLEALVQRIRALGYPVVNRGIKDDTNFRVFRGRVFNIYVLGPGDNVRPHIPTQMPGVLGESLFITNPGDAAMLRQERTLDAIAAGYRDAITAYFREYLD